MKREEPVTWEELDEIVHCEPYVTDEQTETIIRSEDRQHHTVAKSHTRLRSLLIKELVSFPGTAGIMVMGDFCA